MDAKTFVGAIPNVRMFHLSIWCYCVSTSTLNKFLLLQIQSLLVKFSNNYFCFYLAGPLIKGFYLSCTELMSFELNTFLELMKFTFNGLLKIITLPKVTDCTRRKISLYLFCFRPFSQKKSALQRFHLKFLKDC